MEIASGWHRFCCKKSAIVIRTPSAGRLLRHHFIQAITRWHCLGVKYSVTQYLDTSTRNFFPRFVKTNQYSRTLKTAKSLTCWKLFRRITDFSWTTVTQVSTKHEADTRLNCSKRREQLKIPKIQLEHSGMTALDNTSLTLDIFSSFVPNI